MQERPGSPRKEQEGWGAHGNAWDGQGRRGERACRNGRGSQEREGGPRKAGNRGEREWLGGLAIAIRGSY